MKIDNNALMDVQIPGVELYHKGKVRNVYELDGKLLIVATDRISAFDFVFPTGIPGKGQILTTLSNFWFQQTSHVKNHLIETEVEKYPDFLKPYQDQLEGRSVLVLKTKRIDIECVARGYIVGSGWKEYQNNQTVCGIKLPAGLKQAQVLPEPIFTPATKEDNGHDENISFDKMKDLVGTELSEKLRDLTLQIYIDAAKQAYNKGIIIADTKFEFGLDDQGNIILIDEILTPDSSRFWPMDQYQVGVSPVSYDKQFVRDYLEGIQWNKQPPVPELPTEIVQKTREKYLEAHQILTS